MKYIIKSKYNAYVQSVKRGIGSALIQENGVDDAARFDTREDAQKVLAEIKKLCKKAGVRLGYKIVEVEQ